MFQKRRSPGADDHEFVSEMPATTAEDEDDFDYDDDAYDEEGDDEGYEDEEDEAPARKTDWVRSAIYGTAGLIVVGLGAYIAGTIFIPETVDGLINNLPFVSHNAEPVPGAPAPASDAVVPPPAANGVMPAPGQDMTAANPGAPAPRTPAQPAAPAAQAPGPGAHQMPAAPAAPKTQPATPAPAHKPMATPMPKPKAAAMEPATPAVGATPTPWRRAYRARLAAGASPLMAARWANAQTRTAAGAAYWATAPYSAAREQAPSRSYTRTPPRAARVQRVVAKRTWQAPVRRAATYGYGGRGAYRVQVGSFRDAANAQALAAQLRARGIPATLMGGGGGTRMVASSQAGYQVRSVATPDRAQAVRMLGQYKAAGVPAALVAKDDRYAVQTGVYASEADAKAAVARLNARSLYGTVNYTAGGAPVMQSTRAAAGPVRVIVGRYATPAAAQAAARQLQSQGIQAAVTGG